MTNARSIIPGLTVCPDDESGEGIKISTIQGPIQIPQSQKFGNCRSIDEFERLKAIPCGGSQIVYEGRERKTNEIRILKKFKSPYEDGFPKSGVREIGLLKALDHANIIRSYGVAGGTYLGRNYLILEHWTCSLEDLIEKNIYGIYDEHVIKGNMKQLLAGIGYIHECLIIHRNINCENIIFTAEGVLKITGFSTSRYFTRGDMTPGITDLRYRAPELLLQAKKYNAAVDMWSVGCLLARLVLRDFLFKGTSELQILDAINKVLGTPTDKIWPGFSQLLAGIDPFDKCFLFLQKIPYSFMKDVFRNQSLSLQELLQDLLMYSPLGRPSAYMCLNRSYFKEEPLACSPQEMISLLEEFDRQRNRTNKAIDKMSDTMQKLDVGEKRKASQ